MEQGTRDEPEYHVGACGDARLHHNCTQRVRFLTLCGTRPVLQDIRSEPNFLRVQAVTPGYNTSGNGVLGAESSGDRPQGVLSPAAQGCTLSPLSRKGIEAHRFGVVRVERCLPSLSPTDGQSVYGITECDSLLIIGCYTSLMSHSSSSGRDVYLDEVFPGTPMGGRHVARVSVGVRTWNTLKILKRVYSQATVSWQLSAVGIPKAPPDS